MSCNCRHKMTGVLDVQAMKKAQEEAKERKEAIKSKAKGLRAPKTEDVEINIEVEEDKE